jgi:hypothetical protein
LPVVVTVPVRVSPLTVPVPPTEETDPPPVPAPIAARKSAALRDETVLFALKRGNVTAPGLAIVKRLPPSVVAPKLVRATAADEAPDPPLATGSMPVMPVVRGRPVAFVRVAEVGVPKIGVTSVGLVAKTFAPEPVLVVTPVPPEATGSVPVTPVVRGRPVAFVRVAEVGVPRTGVTSVGLVDNTFAPEPVLVVTPVPPEATGSVPVTPVVRGKPVAFVRVAEVGVPRTGVTSVGLVAKTFAPEPVLVVTPVPPEATGRAAPKTKDPSQLTCAPTSVPLLYTTVRVPAGTATPVWPETFTVTVKLEPLMIR